MLPGMSRRWIKAAVAAPAAGPYSLAEIRALRAAGFVTPATWVSADPYVDFTPLSGCPTLLAALDDPRAVSIPGEQVLVMGESRPAPADAVPTDAPDMSTGRRFVLGRAAYESVNDADASPRVSSLGNLALNREREAAHAFEAPALRRSPLLRNTVRYLPVLILSLLLIGSGVARLADNPYVAAFVIALGALLFAGGAWFVFIVAPARWED